MWLDAPTRLLNEGRPAAALEAMLEAWRVRRVPALANLIDVLSDALTSRLPRLEARTRSGLQGLWLDLANERRDVDLGRLLALFAAPPWVAVGQRIERLAQLDDPRVARAFASFFQNLPTVGGIGSARWTLLFAQLERAKDVRSRGALERRLAIRDPRVIVTDQVLPLARRVLEALPDERPTSEELEQVAKLTAIIGRTLAAPLPAPAALLADSARPRRAASEAELLRVIFETPEDDTARLVYSDWLQEQGDPRAELLVLQLKGRQTGREQRRVRELVRANGRAWLGPLEPAIERRTEVFSRGFVSQGRVWFLTARQRAALVGHAAWNTVTSLDVNDSVDGEFLRHTELRGLEALQFLSEREVEHVALRRWPFRRLSTLGLSSDANVTLRRLPVGVFPALTHLAITAGAARERELLERALAEQLPLAGQLVELHLHGLQSVQALQATARWPRLTLVALNAGTGLVFHRPSPDRPWVLDVVPPPPEWRHMDEVGPAVRRFLPHVVGLVTPTLEWKQHLGRATVLLDGLRKEHRLDWVPRADVPRAPRD